MIKAYHYTLFGIFLRIVDYGKLSSHYQRLAREMSLKLGGSTEQRFNELTRGPLTTEIERLSNVFLAKDLEEDSYEGWSAYAYKLNEMVVLGFNCPENLFNNYKDSAVLKTKELSLDYLVEIHAQGKVLPNVRNLLKKRYDGRYKHVNVYEWKK